MRVNATERSLNRITMWIFLNLSIDRPLSAAIRSWRSCWRGAASSRRQAAAAFLDPDRYVPAPPGDLPDLAAAADRLYRAVTRGEKIAVWGDFDADGQTATTLLVSLLRDLQSRGHLSTFRSA